MSGENWPIQKDALDHFGQSSRRQAIEQRRPAVARASDLVGPNIAPYARRVEDLSEDLALISGYVSIVATTNGDGNTPSPSGSFIVMVMADQELGGVQIATRLQDRLTYRRTFLRHPADPATIASWTTWAAL